MKKLLLLLAATFLLAPSLFAIPCLQLYIDGATYVGGAEESWVYYGGGDFDLYVISANEAHTDVRVSMAMLGLGEFDDPTGSNITVDANPVAATDWNWGWPPLEASLAHEGGDLAPHSVFPGWFTEFGAGDFGLGDLVGQTVADSLNPGEVHWTPTNGATGYKPGEYKKFDITVADGYFVHFDAYTLDPLSGKIDCFAPFSHDAGTAVPEPATMILFGLGLVGAGVVRRFRKKSDA